MEADSSPDVGGEIWTGKDLKPHQPTKTGPDEKNTKKMRTIHNPPKEIQTRTVKRDTDDK